MVVAAPLWAKQCRRCPQKQVIQLQLLRCQLHRGRGSGPAAAVVQQWESGGQEANTGASRVRPMGRTSLTNLAKWAWTLFKGRLAEGRETGVGLEI